MKMVIFSALILTFFISCSASGLLVDHEFLTALSRENNRLEGVLKRDIFNKNLENLTYEYYINYLKQNERPSAKGLTRKIQAADAHYFKAKKTSFLLLLLYKKDRMIVCDNSQTFTIDSVCKFSPSDIPPNFEELSTKLKF